MASDSILLEQSEVQGISTLSEEKVMKPQRSIRTKRHYSGAEEDDSKDRDNSPLLESRPAKRAKNSEIKKYTSTAGNGLKSIAPDELEFEIEMAKLDVIKHFLYMKMQMDDDDEVMTKEMEIWTKGGLDIINDGKSPQNEFLMKSLVDNFEETIGNIGQDSKRDMNNTMDNVRKILVKLINRIERSFRPRPYIDAVKVPRRDTASFLWTGLLTLVALLIGVFPDYLLEVLESAVAFYQSTILIFVLFCILYFYDPSSK